jgi:YD repeat-containing protein
MLLALPVNAFAGWTERRDYPDGHYAILYYSDDGKLEAFYYYNAEDTLLHFYKYFYDDVGNYSGFMLEYADGTTVEYDENGRKILYTFPNGNYITYMYNRFSRWSFVTYFRHDGLMFNHWRYYYSTAGLYQGARLTFASGEIYEYNESGKVLKHTLANGTYITYTYRPDGKEDTVVYHQQDGTVIHSWEYHYDAEGNLTGRTLTYATGVVIEYNAQDQKLKYTWADGKYMVYTYRQDGQCDVATYYEEGGTMIHEWQCHYDASGNYDGSTLTYPDGRWVRYDKDGNVIDSGIWSQMAGFFQRLSVEGSVSRPNNQTRGTMAGDDGANELLNVMK